MILITFAVPEESQELIRRLADRKRAGSAILGKAAGMSVAVVHTGMGAAAAQRACERAVEQFKPARLISSGFAGGLDPALRKGDIIVDRSNSEPGWLERVDPAVPRVILESVSQPLDSPAEKARMFETTQAGAVDMETATIAEVARKYALPLLALRVISDAADEALPLPSGVAYDMARQRVRIGAILGHLLLHPGAIPPLLRFASGMGGLQRALADAIIAQLPERGGGAD